MRDSREKGAANEKTLLSFTITSSSAEETGEIGRIIGETVPAGTFIALMGELGAGKTCLTQGIARGLGVKDSYYVTSPSFTLLNEYPGRIYLYHFDFYRLGTVDEIDDLGYEEYVYGNGVTVMEWAERIGDRIPMRAIRITMDHRDETVRDITFEGDVGQLEQMKSKLQGGGFA